MEKVVDKEETKLYGECAYLLNKIFDKTEDMDSGWDELINIIASIDDTKFKTEQELYSNFYKFLRNVYWRIYSWKEPQPFNRITKENVIVAVSDDPVPHTTTKEGFRIWNYDYKMFIWAVQHGFTYGMSTQMIDVDKDLLTAAELKQFEKKAGTNAL